MVLSCSLCALAFGVISTITIAFPGAAGYTKRHCLWIPPDRPCQGNHLVCTRAIPMLTFARLLPVRGARRWLSIAAIAWSVGTTFGAVPTQPAQRAAVVGNP